MNFCSSDGPNQFMGGCLTELIGDLVQKLNKKNHEDFQEPGFFEVKSAKL